MTVVTPAELIAGKLTALVHRGGQPKSGTDWRDVAYLLLTFPDLKVSRGAVRERLDAVNADPRVIARWEEIVQQQIVPESDEDEFERH